MKLIIVLANGMDDSKRPLSRQTIAKNHSTILVGAGQAELIWSQLSTLPPPVSPRRGCRGETTRGEGVGERHGLCRVVPPSRGGGVCWQRPLILPFPL